MTIATQSDYLATNNIHGKPISARMLRTVHMGLAAMEKYRQKSDWKDALWVVNVATSVAGHIACIPVAMIEIAITSQIALIGLTINYLIFSNKNEFLQKRTLMVLSSFCHSFTMLYMSVRV